MQKFVLILSISLSLSFFAAAQSTYYVSSASGNDSNSGKSSSSPWKTLSKLNSTIFRSGDRILFKKGDKWREMLTISSSGNSSSPILLSSYGSGDQPVISGAIALTGFARYSGNVWRKSTSNPQQVFFNGVRGKKVSSSSNIGMDKDWAWSSNYLYVYSSSDPSGKIEVTSKRNGIIITGDYITVEGFQIEKVYESGIAIATNSNNIIIDDCRILQWSSVHTSLAGVRIDGSFCEVKNSTFGKKTGNDVEDQGWAGFHGIAINGKSNSVNNNKIYHSAIENESGEGFYTHGIHAFDISGTTRIFGNYIYHTGGDGISVTSNSRSGDEIHIYENKIEYSGQGGIQAYKTRSEDGRGGKGYIYKNEVSYANRLGGDVGGKGNQSSGIHFNDGVKSGTDANRPYMKWYCYENVVYGCRSPKLPNSADACGIIMDYNANNIEVFRNIIYDNNSVGIQIWNANNCKVSYNIVYGNDGGIIVNATSSTKNGLESANNNEVCNNTFYKNYNGSSKGRNVDAEIFFGQNTKNNVFKNNILYSATEGYAYKYNVTNTSGHVLDNNVVYSDRSIVAVCGKYNQQTFSEWKSHYSSWDRSSKNSNPMFNNAGGADFSLKSNSPAINAGAVIGQTVDFLLKSLVGTPDIGALEYGAQAAPPPSQDPGGDNVILINAMDGQLRDDAGLGSRTGMKNANTIYFRGNDGAVKYSVNIPRAGTWYAWARMYYMSSGQKNSFFIGMNSKTHILGDDDTKYDQWHWDGYKGAPINLGQLGATQYNLAIMPREPGLTLWVDQIILSDDPNYNPNVSGNSSPVSRETILINAMDGQLRDDAGLGSRTGMKNPNTIYFRGGNGAVKYMVDIPKAGTWYVWARMYYMSSGQKNSFFIGMNSKTHVLGDDDTKYDQWHWDGNNGTPVNLGYLNAAQYALAILPREPGLTLWVDQIVLTNDPNYNPNNSLGKEAAEENEKPEEIKAIPENFEISQNFPNPFNPATTIKYAVPEVSQVSLKVYDILGAEVANLVDEVKAPGYYEINFDGSSLASGIYIYQIRTNNFVMSKKMNLVK